jgi:hypothetical protein
MSFKILLRNLSGETGQNNGKLESGYSVAQSIFEPCTNRLRILRDTTLLGRSGVEKLNIRKAKTLVGE